MRKGVEREARDAQFGVKEGGELAILAQSGKNDGSQARSNPGGEATIVDSPTLAFVCRLCLHTLCRQSPFSKGSAGRVEERQSLSTRRLISEGRQEH